MGRSREFDDDAVVRAARDVFWLRGYVATSLSQLQQATGLSKSSLYEAYGSKRGLFERAAQSYLEEIIWPLLAPMEAPGAGRQSVVDYFLNLAAYFRSGPLGEQSRGCLIVNVSMDLNDLDAQAADLVTGLRIRTRGAILNALRSIDGLDDPEQVADMLTSGQMGLMATARADAEQSAGVAQTYANFVLAL
ncbi:TetR/AcrR family transcriptional regulator [Promicromonospora sp. NPDC060204]|uniref:TetR/AcrR family transcriptional regulator n=1 Tax=Promicromonospora sp. NPDC060204 TaxID=3347071 RepID=UPI0036470759